MCDFLLCDRIVSIIYILVPRDHVPFVQYQDQDQEYLFRILSQSDLPDLTVSLRMLRKSGPAKGCDSWC